MKISFVIPVFNSSPFIVETLESIRKEAVGFKYEIILVDDKSFDIKELKSIVENMPEIVVFEKKLKTNAAHSRNLGIKAAAGDFIFLLDSDDHLAPGVLGRRIKIHKNNLAGVVFGNYVVKRGHVEREIKLSTYLGEDIRDYLMLKNGDFRTSTISICRQFFIGTMFDENSKKHQDWAYGIRAFDNGEVIAFDEIKSTLIVSDRLGRMSSSINIQASKYFVDNYLITRSQKNGFSKKHWKFLLEGKSRAGRKFFLSIYCPKNLRQWLLLIFIKFASARLACCLSSRFILFARNVKYFF